MTLVSMLFSNGMTSIISILLTFSVSRAGGLELLGQFALGYAALSLLQIVIRETCLNMALASRGSPDEAGVSFWRALLLAIPSGLAISTAGLIADSEILVIMGWSAVAFCIFDFLRLWIAATRPGPLSLIADVVNLVAVVLGITLTEFANWSVLAILVSWSTGMSVAVGILLTGSRLKIVLTARGLFDRNAATFGVQGLFGSGSVQVANILVGSTQSTEILGALRGASTFAGPANLITATIQSAAIRPLGSSRPGTPERAAALARWLLLSSAIAVPILIASGIVASVFGEELLGEAWLVTAPILVWILADAGVVALTCPAYAVHRADLQAKRVLVISLVVGALRIVVVPLITGLAGAPGAAISFFCLSAMSGLLLWGSYFRYSRTM